MKRRTIGALAGDPRFIPGVYNYCDRWCERCPLSNRCLNYATEKAEEDEEGHDPASRDATNEQFWAMMHETLRETIAMIEEEAKARGVDLNAPKPRAEVAAERAGRRQTAGHSPLARAALAYATAVSAWMEAAKPLFTAKIGELKTQVALEIGDPKSEAATLSDYTDIIQWYQHFIYVKLSRAIESRVREAAEADEELKSFPKDSDGSAKIALIALDRSIAAWSGLRDLLGESEDDRILDLLAQLSAIRREAEKVFPQARSFIRPGFDQAH